MCSTLMGIVLLCWATPGRADSCDPKMVTAKDFDKCLESGSHLPLVKHLGDLAGRPNGKAALAALRRWTLSADGEVRQAMLHALVRHRWLARRLVTQIPGRGPLLSEIRKRMQASEADKKQAKISLTNTDCVVLDRKACSGYFRGVKRPRVMVRGATCRVRCPASTLSLVKPSHCTLERSPGRTVKITCTTSFCGRQCTEHVLVTRVRKTKHKWRVEGRLGSGRNGGDQCGICDGF